jgi:hypothetical protein
VAVLTYYPPSLVGKGGIQFFNMASGFEAQNAAFRRGDFLVNSTTGSITSPSPTGSLATTVPTQLPVVTPNNASSTNNSVQTLYAYHTYYGSGTESLPSAEFTIVNNVGYAAAVSVASSGAPSAATGWNLYVGLVPGGEWQQLTNQSFGPNVAIPYPLTNSVGWNRGATNLSTNLVGIAVDDFDVQFHSGPAASFKNTSPFGADVSGPPMGFYEQYQTKVYTLGGGQRFEISLVQAWYPGLLYSTCGLQYNTAAGCFVADTSQSNKILTIVDKVQGAYNPTYASEGTVGDTGARVVCAVTTSSALLIQ